MNNDLRLLLSPSDMTPIEWQEIDHLGGTRSEHSTWIISYRDGLPQWCCGVDILVDQEARQLIFLSYPSGDKFPNEAWAEIKADITDITNGSAPQIITADEEDETALLKGFSVNTGIALLDLETTEEIPEGFEDKEVIAPER